MPQKLIKLKGIDRSTNEYECFGESEELINLRPHIGGGVRVAKQKEKYMTEVDYSHVYEHSWGNTSNLLAVVDGRVLWIEKDVYLAQEFYGKDIELSSAGNVLVVYCRDNKEQVVYKFEENNYAEYNIDFGCLTGVSITANRREEEHSNEVDVLSMSVDGINDAIAKATSGIASKFNYALGGAAVVGCAYELEDGNEVWSTAFVTIATSLKPELTATNKVRAFGLTDVAINLTFAESEYTGIKRINVYSTKPVIPYDATYNSSRNEYGIRQLPLDEANLQGQVMHYQGSVTPKKGEVSMKLSFGTELSASQIMNVNAGCVTRTGENISLNNRFYYYSSNVVHTIQKPTMDSTGATIETDSWAGYVKLNDEWKLIDGVFLFSPDRINNFMYPMADVKQLAFMRLVAESVHVGTYAVTDYDRVPSHRYEYTLSRDTEMFYVDLKDSAAYNYSYAFDFKPSNDHLVSAEEFYDRMEDACQLFGIDNPDKTFVLRKEFNTLNVSAQYNPLVFPVEYSYSFSGEIKDVVTEYIPISSVQISSYPITVFTTNGIFSMEQGDGSVLYKNILPIQPLVIIGKATSTPYGTFFVSSKNLYLLSGREVVDVSLAMDGKTDTSLRDNTSFQKLCCVPNGPLPDFSRMLSKVDFREYIDDIVMVYDQLNNELYISSRDSNVSYSYVFNLNTKTYHKIPVKYADAQRGARYAIQIEEGDRHVIDLYNETDSQSMILLQSRPFSLEAFATHIQSLKLMVDAKLEEGQSLCFSVFGSDDLYDWKCIVSSQKHDTVLRHIRTNRSARSYRDYIIVINGLVSTDTDISDIIASYTLVNRRLG